MTLERENQLIDAIQSIETRKSALIRQIVAERLAGKNADAALAEMGELSRQKLELTRPSLPIVAA